MAGALFTVGAVFGNVIFIAMSLPLFFLFVLGLLFTPPQEITADTPEIPPKIWMGQELEFIRTITIDGGVGAVTILQELPDEMELVKGNNLKVHWKWWGTETIDMTFRMRCLKKGECAIPPLSWRSDNMMGVTVKGSAGEAIVTTAWPRLLTPGQIRSLPGIAVTSFPLADIPRVGIPSTDFREIRNYVSGDPLKTINWKATARRNINSPLVNEYEKEGKKAVIIFLDVTTTVRTGNSLQTLLEYAVEATGNLVLYFSDRGYRVGLAINSLHPQFFYPDSGHRQSVLILPKLNQLQPDSRTVPLIDMIHKFRSHILNFDPLSIIVTSLDGDTTNTLPGSIKKLKNYYSRRRRFPILLVNITARDMIPHPKDYESSISSLMALAAGPVVRSMSSSGISVANWNPKRESFRTMMSRQVKKR